MTRIDAAPTLQAMDRLAGNIAFGVARGLTQVAKLAQQNVTASLPREFDRPNPFTMQAVSFTPATKDSLVATVFVKDAQAKYLELEETGGTRTPQPGSPINLPVELQTNAYGNIPRGKVAQLLARKDVFIANGKGKTAKLPPGIYQRITPKRSRTAKGALRGKASTASAPAQRGLKLLVAFERRAAYKPRFGFQANVINTVQTQALAILTESVADALATAR